MKRVREKVKHLEGGLRKRPVRAWSWENLSSAKTLFQISHRPWFPVSRHKHVFVEPLLNPV